MIKFIFSIIILLISFNSLSAQAGQLIINEVLYDPPNGLAGDANGDGVKSALDEQFIEICNATNQNLDISGYKIYNDDNWAIRVPNHEFPSGTILPPKGVIVVFGGGIPTGTFGGAIVQTASFGELDIKSSGDNIQIDSNGGVFVEGINTNPFSNNPNESYTRNPDVTGNFEQHNDNTPYLFSPGLRVDSTTFNTIYKTEALTVRGQGGDSTITTPFGRLQMEAITTPGNQLNTTVVWSVPGGTQPAYITPTGELRALSNGHVIVTAQATDSIGISASTTITITGQNVGVDEDEWGSADIQIYPNPTSSFFTIETSLAIRKIEIFSLQGSLIKTISLSTNRQISTQHLAKGTYYVRLWSKNNWTTRILIKE